MPDLSLITFILLCIAFALFGIAAIFLTLIGLPGIWLMIVTALGMKWWHPEWFSWWTLAAVVGLAVIGEIVELAAGAAGSSRVGGGRRAAVGAILGGIVGAIAGAAFPPIIGAVIRGAGGAGIGAAVGELAGGNDWKSSLPIGRAAATGKFLGTIAKTTIAGAVFLILLLALIIS